jgi:hypothetical protein
MEERKKCGKCGEVKFFGEFALSRKAKDGRSYWCKVCATEYNKDRNNRLYTESFVRAKNLKRLYGMTPEEYQALFATQSGVCAVCGQPETTNDSRTGKTKNLQIDHCHTTGRVRALLCKECNNALGLLHDDPVRIRLLLQYAEIHCANSPTSPGISYLEGTDA